MDTLIGHRLYTVHARGGYRCLCSCSRYASRIRSSRASAIELGSIEHHGADDD